MTNNEATYFGYYLHKDGSPIVVEKSEKSEAELKNNGYWRWTFQLFNDEDIERHLSRYNAAYQTNGFNPKPYGTQILKKRI